MLPFPIKENPAIEPFLNKGLKFKMTVDGDTLNISLKKQQQTGLPQS